MFAHITDIHLLADNGCVPVSPSVYQTPASCGEIIFISYSDVR